MPCAFGLGMSLLRKGAGIAHTFLEQCHFIGAHAAHRASVRMTSSSAPSSVGYFFEGEVPARESLVAL
jgi:hypothetical protein